MRSSEDSDYELPGGLHAELREYQKRGYLWMKTLAEYGFGGILADDMGWEKPCRSSPICSPSLRRRAGRSGPI